MGMFRMVLFWALTMYLVIAVVLVTAIENTYSASYIETDTTGINREIYNASLVETGTEDISRIPGVNLNMAVHLNKEIFWIDVMFIYSEFIIWILLLVAMFFPTGDAGN